MSHAIAEYASIPVGAYTRVHIKTQKITCIGDIELKFRLLEALVCDPSVQMCLVAKHILQRHRTESYSSRRKMYRVGSSIICIGEVKFYPEVFGKYVACHVDEFECSVKPGVAGGVSADIGSKCLHIRLHEFHINAVGLEAEVESLVHRINGPVDISLATVGLRYGSHNINTFGGIVPSADNIGIAKQRVVVAETVDMKPRSQ